MKIGILTLSDSAAAGQSEDGSGPLLAELAGALWPQAQVLRQVLPDDPAQIAAQLQHWADEEDVALILTTGGTGFAPRCDAGSYAGRDRPGGAGPGRGDAGGGAGGDAARHARARMWRACADAP